MVKYMYMINLYSKTSKAKSVQLKVMITQTMQKEIHQLVDAGSVSDFVRDAINEKLARLNNDAR